MRVRAAWALVSLSAACRATPIPAAQRYPAGTPFRAQYRTIDGSRLRIIDSGNGTPVLLIHGIGASLYAWRYAVPPLVTAGYRVVAFDNRGFGFSAKPPHGNTRMNSTELVSPCLASSATSTPVPTVL